MKNLRINLALMTILLFFLLLLPSCNNEEIFVAEESTIVTDEDNDNDGEEEDPNTEDEAPVTPISISDDSFSTTENISLELILYENDENLPIKGIIESTNPTNGTLEINDNDTLDNLTDDVIIYTPNPGFSGSDSFEYTVCDATNPENCDTAFVSIDIEPRENDFATELKAFPSAYGAGAYVTGGRGGQVIHVTNLNDSGAGSFREAVNTTGTRTIVFDVSGEINLLTRIWVEGSAYDNLTIAGQTAPEGGITITGYGVNIQVSNVIVRYIRFRNSDGYDGLGVRGGGNVIIDHCSFAWSKDEALDISSYNIGNVTVQYCHFYNCAKAIILGSGSDTSGNIGDFSVLYNTSSSTSHRFPNFSGAGKLDVINNLIHNWRFRTVRMGGQDFMLNLTGNYYQSGVNTLASNLNMGNSTTWGKSRLITGVHKIDCNDTMNPTIYSKYNHIDQDLIDDYQAAWISDPFNELSSTNNGWTSIDFTGYSETNEFPAWTAFKTEATTQPKAEWFVATQLPLLGVQPTIFNNTQLFTELLPTTGSCKTISSDSTINFWRDSLDINSINEIKNDGGDMIINANMSSYGINPTYATVTRPASYDTDNDGMADIWEKITYGDLTKTATGDADGDGYTNLEEFINLVDKL